MSDFQFKISILFLDYPNRQLRGRWGEGGGGPGRKGGGVKGMRVWCKGFKLVW